MLFVTFSQLSKLGLSSTSRALAKTFCGEELFINDLVFFKLPTARDSAETGNLGVKRRKEISPFSAINQTSCVRKKAVLQPQFWPHSEHSETHERERERERERTLF